MEATPTPVSAAAHPPPPGIASWTLGARLRATVLHPLADLRLTVACLAMAIILVFAGTLAQVDQGIWTVVAKYFRSLWVFIPLQIFFPRSMAVPGGLYFPGGWLIGGVLLANLLAAHAVRFKLARNRAGILAIHAGLMVMLLGELVTGLFAVEGNMTIDEGGTCNYVEQIREPELAVVDPSRPDEGEVAVIPRSQLRPGAVLSDELLPFDVEVVSYLVNSAILGLAEGKGKASPATAGEGLRLIAVARPELDGTEPDQQVDVASAYVTLRRKGADQVLGTWLVSQWLEPQPVTLDGKVFAVALRCQRSYRAYSLELIDFRHDRYLGTDIPKNFSSRVRLRDPGRNVDREILIYMNHPLRYAGETFYQASFKPDESGTVLQVVRNPGWLLPYVSCVMVGVGMLWHFGSRLSRVRPTERARVKDPQRILPWLAVAVPAAWILGAAAPARDGDYRLSEFARLPVVYQGRVKPLDTLARTSLMIVSKRQTFTDEGGRAQPAVRWLLDVMSGALGEKAPAEKHKVFRIENDQVLALLGLDERPGFRYALAEFVGKTREIQREAERAGELDSARRDLVDAKILELYEQLRLYYGLARLEIPHMIPPLAADETWKPFAEAAHQAKEYGRDNPAARSLGLLLGNWIERKPEAFNRELAEYRARLESVMPEVLRKADLEVFFNRFEPFYRCSVLYGCVMLLVFCSWLFGTERLRHGAYLVLVLALALHTLALCSRMWLQGRPPVTNLYSSSIFIGWGCAVLAVLLERVYRSGVGSLTGSVAGFATMVIAHHLSGDGDTMEMMQAVLDTNFWLATHVTTIAIGYSACFLAGLLGIVFVLRGVFTRSLDREACRTLGRMIYGIVGFAAFFSFIGTVLGGIWADQSWGRFWGWDPKENGALIIVLWNALILHARWGGMVESRGIALLAVFGNVVTAWSWFGVNMLGIGLHSYGFLGSAIVALLGVVALHLVVIGLGLLPRRWWRSLPYPIDEAGGQERRADDARPRSDPATCERQGTATTPAPRRKR